MNKEIGIGIVTLVLMLSIMPTNVGACIYVTSLEEGDIEALYIDEFHIYNVIYDFLSRDGGEPLIKGEIPYTHPDHSYEVYGKVTANIIRAYEVTYKTGLLGCLVHIKVYRDNVLIDETEAVTGHPDCGSFEKRLIAGEPGNYVVRVSVDLYGAHAREEFRFKVVPETTPTPTPVTPAPIPKEETPSRIPTPTSTPSIPAFQIIPAIVILLAVAYLLKRGI